MLVEYFAAVVGNDKGDTSLFVCIFATSSDWHCYIFMHEQFLSLIALYTDMHQPTGQIVLFWLATRCDLAKNCSKKPKLIVK